MPACPAIDGSGFFFDGRLFNANALIPRLPVRLLTDCVRLLTDCVRLLTDNPSIFQRFVPIAPAHFNVCTISK